MRIETTANNLKDAITAEWEKTHYQLDLTEDDLGTIGFVGNRYGWSNSLIKVGVSEGVNDLTYSEVWEVADGIESDCEGGHDGYPMLDTRSDLCWKLNNLYLSVV